MKPPILNYAVPQRKDSGAIYNYDDSLNLNVVVTGNGKTKFIDLVDCNAELATKTDVVRERDDVGERYTDGLEFATVTKVERESSDDTVAFENRLGLQQDSSYGRAYHLSEFQTRTFVEREHDDDKSSNLLEFVTITRVERERDDQ